MGLFVLSAGAFFVSLGFICVWYIIRKTDFTQLYETAHKNSLWLFYLCSTHPIVSEWLQLDDFKWSGISTNTVIATQMWLAVSSVLLSVAAKNMILIIPLFLLLRESFVVAAMFMRRKRIIAENVGLETMLRLFLSEFTETKSKRESLGRMAGKLTGIWQDSIGKLYRRLGNGGDNTQYYAEFAQTFPNNQHVRLLTQLLNYSDTYGGDIRDALVQLIADVMSDRMDSEKNKSETAATLFIMLIVNCGVAVIALFNLLFRPMINVVFLESLSGKVLLSAAALCCFFSLRLSKNIIEE